jgi:hypothetical protein
MNKLENKIKKLEEENAKLKCYLSDEVKWDLFAEDCESRGMHFTDNDELVDEEGMYYDIQDEYKQ